MSALVEARILDVHHWTDELFSFTCTRDRGFRFQSGQFTMLGLPVDGRPLLRAYSIASAHWSDILEFFSIKVPNGPLTSRLQHVAPGDTILYSRKATGTLVVDNLRPGRHLWLLSTGTGLAPFLSIIRDPNVYERFERIVVTHTCRTIPDLAYRDLFETELPNDEVLGEMVRSRLVYYPTVTREPFDHNGRITDLIRSGRIFRDVGLAPFTTADDRIMICGAPQVLADTTKLLQEQGFEEGSNARPGDFVVEKAFVER